MITEIGLFCEACKQPCEIVVEQWNETVEFWGMKSLERFYSITSKCCGYGVMTRRVESAEPDGYEVWCDATLENVAT
jgi:hypothetical protein